MQSQCIRPRVSDMLEEVPGREQHTEQNHVISDGRQSGQSQIVDGQSEEQSQSAAQYDIVVDELQPRMRHCSLGAKQIYVVAQHGVEREVIENHHGGPHYAGHEDDVDQLVDAVVVVRAIEAQGAFDVKQTHDVMKSVRLKVAGDED